MRNKYKNGFTLLEVVIAFAVVALVLAAIVPVLSISRQHLRQATQMDHAVSLARSKIEEAALLPESEGGALLSGEDEDLSWNVSVNSIVPAGSQRAATDVPLLRSIRVRVTRKSDSLTIFDITAKRTWDGS